MKRKIIKLDRLKELREQNKMTQSEVAKAVDVSESTYFMWEKGAMNCPIHALIKFTKIYGVSMDYILEITDNPVDLSRE